MASRIIARVSRNQLKSRITGANSRGFANAAAAQQVASQPLEQRRGLRKDVSPFLPFGIFDIWEPMTSNRSLRQMLDTIDRYVDTPAGAATGSLRPSLRTPWDIIEKPDAFYMRVDMPGLDKAEVKISVEDEELVIRGEHKPAPEEEVFCDTNRSCNTRMVLPKEVDASKIKAELKNGVLTIVVPKLKPEEKVVTHIQVS